MAFGFTLFQTSGLTPNILGGNRLLRFPLGLSSVEGYLRNMVLTDIAPGIDLQKDIMPRLEHTAEISPI